jgi:hypothetical protein
MWSLTGVFSVSLFGRAFPQSYKHISQIIIGVAYF